MENHENSGHEDKHTEGNRQSYPKGWYLPLIGLLIVALGFTVIGTCVFSASGTDRWGKKEQCEMKDGKCCGDEKECGEGKECKDKKGECKDEKADGEAKVAPTSNTNDSIAAKPAVEEKK